MIATTEQCQEISKRIANLRDIGGQEAVARVSKVDPKTISNLINRSCDTRIATYTAIMKGIRTLERKKEQALKA